MLTDFLLSVFQRESLRSTLNIGIKRIFINFFFVIYFETAMKSQQSGIHVSEYIENNSNKEKQIIGDFNLIAYVE